MDLLISPPAAELFHRVIVQSPPLVDLAQPPEVATGWAQALSDAAGSAGPFDRARLMELPAERIVELHEHLLQQPGFVGTRGGALPTIDPATIPASPREDPGASPDIDVLIGSTAQEGTFFFGSPWRSAPPPERIPGIVAHLCDTDEPAAVIARYRDAAAARGAPTDDPALLIEIATDAMVAGPAARWATARAAALTGRPAGRGGRVYRYRVDHPGAGPALSATHTTEVPLLFGTWRDGGAGERLGGQAPGTAEVAREVASAWAGFVHDGTPGWGPVHGDDAPSEMGIFGGVAPLSVVSLSPDRDDSEMCVP
jgi:para-nitrobenzyl esterase